MQLLIDKKKVNEEKEKQKNALIDRGRHDRIKSQPLVRGKLRGAHDWKKLKKAEKREKLQKQESYRCEKFE